ncbi:DUF2946 domain-containing protein [Sphingomonas sp. TF3]|uniref:DUF2946 family protein n=1 Tax=Sphingomonas sp. TF3 TaxID=2495580 RepID=UPI000F8975E1|nr:DUF2946 family protein [Sphingomonas sp. TF3]RUN75195.1 DUF2946 domain-containing protein [Sphingomonas sp. TF3]
MHRLRAHIQQHRALAAWLLAFALLLKVVVPSGYMLDTSNGVIRIAICSGMGPVKTMAMAMPGMADSASQKHHKDGEKADQPCAFAGLNAHSVAATDPILLALAIAFVMALGSRRIAPPLIGLRLHLRPPLRGPPATL